MFYVESPPPLINSLDELSRHNHHYLCDFFLASTYLTIMPIPTPMRPADSPPVFPHLTHEQIDAARVSSWYHTFEDITIPSTIIDLDEIGEKEAFLEVCTGSHDT
jgi:hypothetical protein